MPAKPSVNKCDEHNSMVNRHIGTAYDNVRIVAEHIAEVINLADGIEAVSLYLGAFSTPPTEGWNGEPLQSGNFYLNTTTNTVDYYDADGMIWVSVDSESVVQAAQAAIAARDAAILAQAAAELAETNAESSAAAALLSEQNATLAEASSQASANASASSASDSATSAAEALASENAAKASETASAQSESNAANSAFAAATSESNTGASEAAAANSAVVAAGYAADAEAAFDNFTDLYLGAKATDPTTDNDGNPLQVGATYWNSTSNDLRYWSGAMWDIPEQTAIQAANDAISARDDAQLSETNAAASEAAAAQSETNAAQSAASASTSESSAANSASDAQTSASEAATSATNAATSETNAATSENNAATSEANAAQSAADAQQSADDVANALSEIEWKQFVRNGADLNQMMKQNSLDKVSGFVAYGKHSSLSNQPNINEGMFVSESSGNLFMGSVGSSQGASKTDYPRACIAGVITDILNVNNTTDVVSMIKFPEAPDGTVTFNSATGEVIQHADTTTAFALADTSDDIEVVINRVDMFGGEFFLEEVTQANSFVYPKGMIQSQATSMNGITTTTSNRPVSYYAVYEGDTGSQGRGVDFWAASTQEKIDMLSDESNNLFLLPDDRLVQWRMRQRTIAGAGNGDWENINPMVNLNLGYTSLTAKVVSQGARDTVAGDDYQAYNSSTNPSPNVGVFTSSDGDFFHVWGTVPRLNQGAYHPSFNPSGASKWWVNDGGSFGFWHTSFTSNTPSSTAQCFDYHLDNAGGYPTVAGKVCALQFGGVLGSTSGRDDGRFYDAIYASGLNGVIDWRLSAYDMSSREQAEKVNQKVKTGVWRGMSKLPFTTANIVTLDGLSPVEDLVGTLQFNLKGKVGDIVWVEQSEGDYHKYTVSSLQVNGNITFDSSSNGNDNCDRFDNQLIILQTQSNISVEGNVENSIIIQDVIGDPNNIVQTTDLAQGWYGYWIPQIPVGGSQAFKLTRKGLGNPIINTRTLDNGATWVSSAVSYNQTTNEYTWSAAAGQIGILTYTLAPYITAPASNSVIFNGEAGVGSVLITDSYEPAKGVLLNESVTGKIGTGVGHTTLHPLRITLEDGILTDYETMPYTGNPEDSRIIYKQSVENNLLALSYDDTINYHKLTKPYGYVINRARAGEQIEGVDL